MPESHNCDTRTSVHSALNDPCLDVAPSSCGAGMRARACPGVAYLGRLPCLYSGNVVAQCLRRALPPDGYQVAVQSALGWCRGDLHSTSRAAAGYDRPRQAPARAHASTGAAELCTSSGAPSPGRTKGATFGNCTEFSPPVPSTAALRALRMHIVSAGLCSTAGSRSPLPHRKNRLCTARR